MNCDNCKKPMEPEIVDDTVFVGNSKRTESRMLKNCKECRDKFMKELFNGEVK